MYEFNVRRETRYYKNNPLVIIDFVLYIRNRSDSKGEKPARKMVTEKERSDLRYPVVNMSQQMIMWHCPTTWCTYQVIIVSQWILMCRRNWKRGDIVSIWMMTLTMQDPLIIQQGKLNCRGRVFFQQMMGYIKLSMGG